MTVRLPQHVGLHASRWVLAVVFLVAAVPKVVDPASFARTIDRYDILPPELVSPITILLPWLEICAAIAVLLLPKSRQAGAVVLTTLLLGFSTALALLLVRGETMACGCFGGVAEWLEHPPMALARNGALLVLAITVYVRSAEPREDSAYGTK